MASLFPGRTLKNVMHTSCGNPVEFDQSDGDFETPKLFPTLSAICIRCSANIPTFSIVHNSLHCFLCFTVGR